METTGGDLLIPAWIENRLDELCNQVETGYKQSKMRKAFALYIEAHEEAPPTLDPDVQVVRNILHAHQRAMTPPDSGWGNMSYEKGSYDNTPLFQAALAAYKNSKE